MATHEDFVRGRKNYPKPIRRCVRCGGLETAHFPPDKQWPQRVCLCGTPDGPCGCPGFKPARNLKEYYGGRSSTG
ncbi:MAG: hypothetical protein GF334_00425 [Candidatus Altiarchaeales archaeon]|nr:hypothetical protein [Candidatus Altiarchaeales archaeon]